MLSLIFIIKEIFIANKIGSIKSNNESNKKFIKSKIGKLEKLEKLSKFKNIFSIRICFHHFQASFY